MTMDNDFDVIVVGSGAGGAATAYRLTIAGQRVLLLEKGAVLPRDGSTLDVRRVVHDGEFLSRESWQDGSGQRVVPEEHFNLGGKTAWYGAAILRFAPHEFEADDAHGCPGWPIGYRDLESEYGEAEHLLGVRTFPTEPDLAVIAARLAGGGEWQSTQLPLSLSTAIENNPNEATHFDGFASVAGLKADAASAFLQRVERMPNLRIVTDAEVVELLGRTSAPPRVTGVRLADGREYRAAVTVLAAGAMHSPRLLQRFVARQGIAHLLPGAALIGANLKLHLLTALIAISAGGKTDRLRKTLLFTNSRFPHSSVQPLGFDGELIATLVPRAVPRSLAAAVGRRAYGFFLQTEDGSAAANRVAELGAATTAEPIRLMDYDERRLPAAAREHRAFVRGFQFALLRTGMPSFTKRIGLSGTAHVCGTLIAGSDPQRSVVDAEGRVHGLAGLRVADGSVLPRSSRVNPSLTIYAWGLRVGARLARQFGAAHAAGLATTETIS